MCGSSAPFRQSPQPCHGVVLVVAVFDGLVRVGVEEHFSAFGHEEEQHPVHKSEQLSEVVVGGQFTVADAFP